MSREEKELLYEIASWRSKDYYNRIDVPWNTTNYLLDEKCKNMLSTLELEYSTKYGSLPEWKFINDVWKTMRQLKEELNG